MPAPSTSVDEYVDRLLAAAPPLTPAQADRLGALLTPAPVASDRA